MLIQPKIIQKSSKDLLGFIKRREDLLNKLHKDKEYSHPALENSHRWSYTLGTKSAGYDDLQSTVTGFSEGEGWADFLLTKLCRDHHGDAVAPMGVKKYLPFYAANPVVFFSHNSEYIPIANASKPGQELQLTLTDDEIRSRAYFNFITKESEDVFKAVCAGVLKGASIGFIPVLGEIIEPEGQTDNEDEISFDLGGIYFKVWRLLEYSVVPIPANPEALRAHLSKHTNMSSTVRKKLEVYSQEKPIWSLSGFNKPVEEKKENRPGLATDKAYFDDTKEKTTRWNPSLSKAFDIENQKLRPLTVEYDFASKHIGCKVKNVSHITTVIPSTKLGSFLSAWRDVTRNLKLKDIRNIIGDCEAPPIYEVIQLNSKKSDSFLIEAICFYEGEKKLVVSLSPTWYGLHISLYTEKENKNWAQGLVDKAWQISHDQYNFLKGEAFSLSGSFIPKTTDKFDEIFLSEKNTDALRRTLKAFNEKGNTGNFANRGQIFMGPPGTGKTLSGRAIRNSAEGTFIWLSARDFYRSGAFGGLTYAFDLAKELSPSVLFIEDVDNWLDSYSIDMLKTEMDGIGRSSGIWTILTTNFPELLPEALIDRPGRFHDILLFDLPDDNNRRKMLKQWLSSDVDKDVLELTIKETEGYSGAHIYELVHFAHVLQDQESKSLSEALKIALVKIKEQRELITGRKTRHKGIIPKIKAKLLKDYSRKNVFGKNSVNDLIDTKTENKETEVQALLFDTSKFKAEEDIVKSWLSEHNYSSTDIYLSNSSEEPHIAICFDAELCEPGTGRKEEIEDGVTAIVCVRKSLDAKAQEQIETESIRSVEDVTQEKINMDEILEEEEEKEIIPHGCSVLLSLGEHLEAIHDIVVKQYELIDNDATKKFVTKLYKTICKLSDSMDEYGKSRYSKNYKELGLKQEDLPSSEDETEEEKNVDQEQVTKSSNQYIYRITKKDSSSINDTSDFLDELATEPNLKKTQKSACKLHSTELKTLSEKYTKVSDKIESEEKDLEAERILHNCLEMDEKLRKHLYQLTGIEI